MTAVPQFDLTGRVALVTGASSGFGAHFSRLLAAAGTAAAVGVRVASSLRVSGCCRRHRAGRRMIRAAGATCGAAAAVAEVCS